jgi:hypothetical protein
MRRVTIILHFRGYPGVLVESAVANIRSAAAQAGASRIIYYRIGTISERDDRHRRLSAIGLTITVAQKL